MSHDSRAVILVFVRAPERGQVKTRLAASIGEDAALTVYRRLAEHALRAAGELHGEAVVRVHYTPAWAGSAVAAWLGPGPEYRPQRGESLGERMEHAFGEAFADGFERVAIVGSDLAEMTSAHLAQALTLLRSHRAVIGPARDGGYWLLGLRAPAPFLFDDMPWSTPEVLGLTVDRLRAHGLDPAFLPELTDVDRAADLPPGWDQR